MAIKKIGTFDDWIDAFRSWQKDPRRPARSAERRRAYSGARFPRAVE